MIGKRLAIVMSLCASTFAQTFVVDAANGPGTHFTDLAAATAAVPSGSVLQVRAGLYYAFTISGKSLKVLGEPGARVVVPLFQSIHVGNLAANQSVVLRNLDLGSANITPAPFTLSCGNCQGAILLEDLELLNSQVMTLRATNCQQMLVRDFVHGGTWARLEVDQSHVVTERCGWGNGQTGSLNHPSAVRVSGGSLQAVDSRISGGVATSGASPNGIDLVNGDLRLLGATSVQPGSVWGTAHGFAVGGSGRVRYEPSTTFPWATVWFAAGITTTQKAMPRLTSTVAGGVSTATLHGPVGHFGIVVVSLPSPKTTVPGIEDPLWIDQALTGALVAGTIGAGAPVQATFAVPAVPLSGVRATWQAVTWDFAATLQLSNPSFTILP